MQSEASNTLFYLLLLFLTFIIFGYTHRFKNIFLLENILKPYFKMNQEQIMQFQLLEQEANKLSQQMQLVENNLNEILEIKSGLEEIDKKETKEILANIGKKIYIPVEIKEKNLIIEVGNKKFLKKTIPETRELIEEQIVKLDSAKQQINERLEELQEDAGKLMIQIEKSQKHEHSHDAEDECEDENKNHRH